MNEMKKLSEEQNERTMPQTLNTILEEDHSKGELNRFVEYRAIFDIFDNDGDNTINPEELRDVMKSLGYELSEDDIEEMISDLLKNQPNRTDKSINMKDFTIMMNKRRKNADLVEEYTEAFRVFDHEDTGKLKIDEMMQIMNQFGEDVTKEEIAYMFNDADVDGDKLIDYRRFIRLLLFK